MNRYALASALLTLISLTLPGAGDSPAQINQVKLNGQTFTLPAGFTIELVAGPPLVDRPITADFDEEGRLYVGDSSGSNERVAIQLKTKPHRIVRLADRDGDGRFDQAVVFADKMMFPEGTMWRGGSLYVAAVPAIWKLTDTDGDGMADRREVWFDGKTMTGCANDLHGPYRGPDGWIYWCKGAFAPQKYERPGAAPFTTRAAHVFRARPNGSAVEPVMTGGMDNPVDLVFTPGGERIFTTTFFQFPGGGQRDGLVHAVYGGIYGKDWDVIHDPGHRWTGPQVMPVLTQLGPAAPSGLHRYESRAFGKEYEGNLFAALFNLQKVTRHVLEPNGATFTTRDSDFVVSSSKDFHPTDVLEDADGSLLVIDTGGWYKLCCPTSQLVKPDVHGAIYRVYRTDAVRPKDPRGLKLDWVTPTNHDLAKRLDDPRPAVRRRATEALGSRGAGAIGAIANAFQAGPAEARCSAVWCATRIDHPSARALGRRALSDSDPTVRQAAAHSASVWRDRDAVQPLVALLKNPSLHNRRAAAEALGRIGDKAAVPGLLAAASDAATDRMLEHSLTYALIEIGDAGATAAGLQSANVRTRRCAMVALDQIPAGKLPVAAVVQALKSPDAKLAETAWWVAGRHAEWGAELATDLRERLAAKTMPAAERDRLAQQLARLARAPAIQQWLAAQVRDAASPPEARRIALRAIAGARLTPAPAAWISAVTAALGTPALRGDTIATARALRLPKQAPIQFAAALRTVAADSRVAAADRLGALAAIPGGAGAVEPAVFAFLRARLNGSEPAADRALAADILARAKLSDDQLLTLAESIRTAGPMEMPRLLEAFSRPADAKVGRALIASLLATPARTSLRADTLRALLARYEPAVAQLGAGLLATLDADAGKQKARLEGLLARLPAGDVRRGQAVFNNPKVACVACHAIGYLGGTVGPDLTRIGSIRTERDLLESVVFPSASLVRGYEPVRIVTRNGDTFSGVLRRDAADEVVLATGPNQEARIPRADIEEMEPSRVSIMPAGLDQQLTIQEMADLVAFLRACR